MMHSIASQGNGYFGTVWGLRLFFFFCSQVVYDPWCNATPIYTICALGEDCNQLHRGLLGKVGLRKAFTWRHMLTAKRATLPNRPQTIVYGNLLDGRREAGKHWAWITRSFYNEVVKEGLYNIVQRNEVLLLKLCTIIFFRGNGT